MTKPYRKIITCEPAQISGSSLCFTPGRPRTGLLLINQPTTTVILADGLADCIILFRRFKLFLFAVMQRLTEQSPEKSSCDILNHMVSFPLSFLTLVCVYLVLNISPSTHDAIVALLWILGQVPPFQGNYHFKLIIMNWNGRGWGVCACVIR